ETAQAQADAARQKALDEQQMGERVKQLFAKGQGAFDAKQYGAAVSTLQQAKTLAPDNVDVLAALTRAEQAHERTQAEVRRVNDDAQTQKTFKRLLDSGKTNLANKQYDAAKLALTQALVLKPGDPDATARLKD